jgi:hypothetical protein
MFCYTFYTDRFMVVALLLAVTCVPTKKHLLMPLVHKQVCDGIS